MKINNFLIKITILSLLSLPLAAAENSNYFHEGKKLYEKKKFDESKIFFERDIVHNPLSEGSYLYLAKIFNKTNDFEQEEVNLNNALLINPDNSEAIYMLTIIKIEKSDYKKAKELLDKYILVCKNDCSKKFEMEKKYNKIVPKDGKN